MLPDLDANPGEGPTRAGHRRAEHRRLMMGAVRRWLGRAGLVGIGCVAGSSIMMAWSIARGVHCPGCDYFLIAAGLPWWEAFYRLKHDLLLLGAGIGLAATLAGKPRYPGAIALAGALLALGLLTYR